MSVTLAPNDRKQRTELSPSSEYHASGSSQPGIRIGPDLQQRLRCPACGSPLHLNGEECACLGGGCGKRFHVMHGVPVLIDEESSVFSLRQALSRLGPANATPWQRALRWLRERLPELSANPVAAENLARFHRLLLRRSTPPRLLVLGGAWVGAGMKPLLGDPRIECAESDVWLSERTHLVCDAHQIPFEAGTFDGVVVQAVLEHVADPERCVGEIHRVLNPGGLVYAETAFLQQVHAGRHDFARFTPVGHRRLFRRFEQIDAGAAAGPAVALAWAWQHFLLSFTATAAGRAVATAVGACSSFWLKYLDQLLLERPAALDAASACYFLGARQEFRLSDRQVIAGYSGSQRDVI